MATAVIDITDLYFSYSSNKPTLEIKKFQLFEREKVFLHGPSGTGKTTLLGLLAGILEVKNGSLKMLGKEFARSSGKERDAFRGANLGYIFQMFNLIPYLNAQENILLPCELNSARRRNKSMSELVSRTADLARALGIESCLSKKITELSVGQQQRVAVARALLGEPPLILADEPTSALDADARSQFIEVLFEQCQKQGTALLFVSHDRSLSGRFDRTVSLADINLVK